MDNAHALVVGIANYQYINRLPPTVRKDAKDIYHLLINSNHCGYPTSNVKLLLDDRATQRRLRQALADLAERSDKDSTIFIYISSHGGRIESGSHIGEYLLPVDVDNTSVNSLAQTAISGIEFTEALHAVPARKVVAVFDCCHAGGIGQPKNAKAPIIKAGLPDSYYEVLIAGRGQVILASSRDTEYSYVLPGAENSLFTEHLLTGLRGGIPSEDGLIRVFDLFEYLQPRVTGKQPNQHPIFKAELEENFPVALYLGGQQGIVPKDEAGFRYDAYISYADKEPDISWVWNTLVPFLKKVGLRVAVSGVVETPGVALVVEIDRAITQSKRTVIVLSENYLTDNLAHFQSILAHTKGVVERRARVLPLLFEKIDKSQLKGGLGELSMLDLTHPYFGEMNFRRLPNLLKEPLPEG